MAKVLVLYYSSYGHIEIDTYAVAEGARAAGATGSMRKRVPETVPDARSPRRRICKPGSTGAPSRRLAELANYDAIIVGASDGVVLAASRFWRWGASGSRRAASRM